MTDSFQNDSKEGHLVEPQVRANEQASYARAVRAKIQDFNDSKILRTNQLSFALLSFLGFPVSWRRFAP